MTARALIRKTDKSIEKYWEGPVGRIDDPDRAGAVLGFVAEALPLPKDYGDFVLVAAAGNQPTLGAGERMVGPTFDVGDGPNFPTTATWTVETTPRPTVISYNEFRARFTAEELPLVKAAVWADADALDLSMMASANNSVDLLGQTADDFLSAMVMAEAITPQRKTVILTP